MRPRQVVKAANLAALKRELLNLGPLHPGSLSRQKRNRGGTYYQLSYSSAGENHTTYVRPEDVPAVRRELANYRKFRELIRRWLDCEIGMAKIRRSTANPER